MHTHSLQPWQHQHAFLGDKHAAHERQTWFVVALTAVMMVVEIIGGQIYGSMAVVADGWHMSTHASALAIAALAYRYARKRVDDPRFSFGTGKLGELAAYTSAIILALVALFIAYESIGRLVSPIGIDFDQAIIIACVGLAVNVASVWLLSDSDHHHHGHEHEHDGDHHHDDDHHSHDHNFRAAYIHVLADAMTSVLAIAGLLGGRFYGWTWMDPMMGIVGALVIASWSWSLVRASGAVLIDTLPDAGLAQVVRARLETNGDRVSDLHLWRVGPGHAALVVAVVSDHPETPDVYKARLADVSLLSHVTVEVNKCSGHDHEPLAA